MKHRTLLPILICLAFPGAASAHAFLDHAEPKVGAVLPAPPALVKTWFTQKLVLAFSELRVFDERGKEIDLQDRKLDPADASVLSVSLPALAPGTYKVVWRAVSVDTHVTNGSYSFKVTGGK